MVNLALLVRLEAKPGKERDVEAFLRGGLAGSVATLKSKAAECDNRMN
jgi:hypothetical protein